MPDALRPDRSGATRPQRSGAAQPVGRAGPASPGDSAGLASPAGRGWVIAALVALAALPYANALEAGFVYDDAGLVVAHPAVQGDFDLAGVLTSAYWGEERAKDTALWRPLTTLSFALDDAIADDSARWMHATNVAFHAGVVLLGFLLAQRLGASRGAAAACAALFAVHPLHTEAVTWISGRAELLAALGILATLLASSTPGVSTARRAAACAAATSLAMASKESAAFVPFAILYLGWARTGQLSAAGVPALASLAAVLAFALLRTAVLGVWGGPVVEPFSNPMSGTSLLERLPTVLDAAGRYIALVGWPAQLTIDYGPPALGLAAGLTPHGALGAAAGLALLGAAVALPSTVEGRAAGLAIGAFGVASNLIVVIGTNFAERLFYLPSFGLLLIAAAAASRLSAGPISRASLAALLALALVAGSARTWIQNRAYEDELTLSEVALAVYPNAPKMSYNRARELLRRGRLDEAVKQAEWTLELRASDSWTRIVLANALARLDRQAEAERVLRTGLEVSPKSPIERARLLELLEERGADAEIDALAEWALLQGATEAPWPARAAIAAQRRGDLELATQRWRAVALEHSTSADAWTELARVAYGSGDSASAREAFERAIALEPARAAAANGLAWLLLDEGADTTRALALAERAVGEAPIADHLDTLARALEAAGRCAEALARARQAAELDPEYSPRRVALEAKCGPSAS